jgi:CHAD domain-containing protein
MSSLESLLLGAWHDWRRWFRRCRRTASRKAVHQTRVQSRRVLAVLSLFDAGGYRHTRPIREVVTATLHALSELRDIDVQLRDARTLAEAHPLAHPFSDHLRRRKRRLRKAARASLRRIHIKPAAHACKRLARADAADSPAAAERTARPAMMGAWDEVEDRLRKLDAADAHSIHRVRVALKNVRYMLESGLGLDWLDPRLEAVDGAALVDAVHRMGQLHDIDMLSSRLDAFANKRAANAAAVASVQAAVRHRQDELLREVTDDLPMLHRIHASPSEPRGRHAASARHTPQRRGG